MENTEQKLSGLKRAIKNNSGLIRFFIIILILVTTLIGSLSLGQREFRRYDHPRDNELYSSAKTYLIDALFCLSQFYKANNRYPTNDEGLIFLPDNVLRVIRSVVITDCNKIVSEGKEPADFNGYSAAFLGNQVILSNAGLIGPYFIPIIYENRQRLDPALFSDSPVNDDTDNIYSAGLGKGIYVYLLGIKIEYDKELKQYNDKRAKVTRTWIIWLSALFMLFCAYFWVCWQSWRLGIRAGLFNASIAITVTSGILLATTTSPALQGTCYNVVVVPFEGPDQAKTLVYYELLEKYRKRGVIKDETADKIKKTLEGIHEGFQKTGDP